MTRYNSVKNSTFSKIFETSYGGRGWSVGTQKRLFENFQKLVWSALGRFLTKISVNDQVHTCYEVLHPTIKCDERPQ